MFRLCSDQSLVDLLLDPTRTPTNDEYEEIEACFQRGNIRDSDDDGGESCPGEGEDVYDSQGVRRECCPGLVESLEDRDPSDPLIGTYPKIIVCRPSRRNLRGTA